MTSRGKLTQLEKVNACMALLIELCMRQTNADKMTLETTGVHYKGKLLGDYKLVITKLTPPKQEVEL